MRATQPGRGFRRSVRGGNPPAWGLRCGWSDGPRAADPAVRPRACSWAGVERGPIAYGRHTRSDGPHHSVRLIQVNLMAAPCGGDVQAVRAQEVETSCRAAAGPALGFGGLWFT